MSAPGSLDGLIPFLQRHMLCTGALEADVENIGTGLGRVWAACSACGAYYDREFTAQRTG